LTAQEFRRGVKRDKTHYTDLKDNKHFNLWNRGFVATAFMHHTHHVLDEEYVPRTPTEIGLFHEMQTFMYAVFEKHLRTDTGKSLVSRYEVTRDAQSIYKELKSMPRAQLRHNSLVTLYSSTLQALGFLVIGVVHHIHLFYIEKEQVAHYEKLEMEAFPPKQKLRMLQNTVGDVTDLANVKQLGDQIIARGGPSLDFEGYLELLLSACSTYDKNYATPNKAGPRNVYTTDITHDVTNEALYDAHSTEVYHVDTDISDIVVYETDTRPKSNSLFLPREEWLKLSQEKRDELISERRKERALQYGSNKRNSPAA
jgi:hypothetical protein